MRNAEKYGESIYYFESGELKSIRNYKHGDRHGEFITYNVNGSIKRKALWENNKKIK